MKKVISAILAVVMLCLCFGTGMVFAAEGDYELIVNFDSSLGGVVIETGGQTTAAEPPETAVWNPGEAMSKGAEFNVLNGAAVVSAAGEDFKYASLSSAVTIDSYSFNSTIQGSGNGSVTTDGVSGNVIKVDCKKSGTMSIAVNLSATKGVKAVNTADINNLLVDYTAETAGDYLLPFDVEAGQSYYFWGHGTKPKFYGLVFSASTPIAAKAGETVTIKATPNENGLLGNVTLDDESVAIEKNSDMTECTFTMPEKNLDVNVGFVNKSVQDETSGVTFDSIKGMNTDANSIFEDLSLIQGYGFSIGYADVSWQSSNPEIISIGGTVNTDNESHTVTLTAVFTFQDYPNLRFTKDFVLTVMADTDDAGAVAAAKESLSIGDISAVKVNLELPVTGRRGTTITWTSDNPEVISTEGVVNRRKDVNTEVTLTASISRGNETDTKIFVVTVLGYTAVEIERIAVSNSDGRVVVAPTDGGYVSHIVYTDSISNADRTGDELLLVAVYNKSDETLTSCKSFNLSDITETVGEETILTLSPTDIPVNSNSEIKLFAFDSISSLKPLMDKPFTYECSVVNNATIYVAGDSTACEYVTSGKGSDGKGNDFPRTGWAQVLGDFFTDEITVKDLARSGRSSLSFRSEDNYKTIMDGLKPGDYFIIQFGHNDSKNDDRYTDPTGDRFTDGSYKNSIYQYYVKPALDKGAYPIITTSIAHCIQNEGSTHMLYVNDAKELAQELGLPYVDLYAKTREYIDANGVEKAHDIYAFIKNNDSRFVKGAPLPLSFKDSLNKSTIDEVGDFANSKYVGGGTDTTHIQYYGAQMISQWACDELEELGHPLTQKRSIHVMTAEDLPSYADATSVE